MTIRCNDCSKELGETLDCMSKDEIAGFALKICYAIEMSGYNEECLRKSIELYQSLEKICDGVIDED